MGLYRSVGRPLFFALPPEAAHRVAGALLGLPLPWARIGGAVDDPRLRLRLAGIELRNPVGLAAGFDKACRRLGPLGSLGFGYVVGGTVTRAARMGNPKPRIVRIAGRQAMVNSMAFPNPGTQTIVRELRRQHRTAPRFVSLADEETADVLANHAAVEPMVDAVELNASSPNSPWRRNGDTEVHLRKLLAELRNRRAKPLFVKLPPFRTAAERDGVLALARAAQDGGADGLTCSNTLPVSHAGLSTGRGGLSGRPLFEGTVRMVREVRAETGGEMPINASGGILSASDAIACIEAGASTVQLYTGLVFSGPRIVREITAGLSATLRAREAEPASLAGAV